MEAPTRERTSWFGGFSFWSKKASRPGDTARPVEKEISIAPKSARPIGIDLGTSYTAVSYVKDGVPIMIQNNQGHETTPSVVHFCGLISGQVLVGEEAVKKRRDTSTKTIAKVKRLLGRKRNNPSIGQQRWTFKIDCDSSGRACVRVGKELVSPEQISSHILQYMKEIANRELAQESADAVITVPANFTNAQREATITAAKLAGLNVLRIVNEPTAAAIAFSALNEDPHAKRRVLVFDLGGGTFDVSVVEIEGKQTKVLATEGLSCLGGNDFDERIYEEAVQRYHEIGIKIVDQDGQDGVDWVLMEECEKAKRALSRRDFAPIRLLRYEGKGFDLTYDTFLELCEPLFELTIKLTNSLLREESIDESTIDEILLVGGSTKIRRIREMLRDRFPNMQIRKDIDPDLAVAKGAAILADFLSKKQSSAGESGSDASSFVFLFDVAPLQLGLRLDRDRCKPLIYKNTRIPFTAYELCTNAKDNATMLTIEILEGNDAHASNNDVLATVDIEIEPKAAGQHLIKVELSIDDNGILSVSAIDHDTHKTVSVTIRSV